MKLKIESALCIGDLLLSRGRGASERHEERSDEVLRIIRKQQGMRKTPRMRCFLELLAGLEPATC